MNAKTLEAIKRHGESLLRAFPDAMEKDPVALCKKLRRIETGLSPIILKNCNEGVAEAEMMNETAKAELRVCALLGLNAINCKDIGLFVNLDPRGYALKLSEEWTREWNHKAPGISPIYQDWGGYGILAPDLTVETKKANYRCNK